MRTNTCLIVLSLLLACGYCIKVTPFLLLPPLNSTSSPPPILSPSSPPPILSPLLFTSTAESYLASIGSATRSETGGTEPPSLIPAREGMPYRKKLEGWFVCVYVCVCVCVCVCGTVCETVYASLHTLLLPHTAPCHCPAVC